MGPAATLVPDEALLRNLAEMVATAAAERVAALVKRCEESEQALSATRASLEARLQAAMYAEEEVKERQVVEDRSRHVAEATRKRDERDWEEEEARRRQEEGGLAVPDLEDSDLEDSEDSD